MLTFRFFPGNALNMAAKGYARNSDRVYCAKKKIKIRLRSVMYKSKVS
jgi:hypothetical protein